MLVFLFLFFLFLCKQSKLADSSDWPTLGSEAAATNISNNKKEISNATSNGDLREKDNKKPTSTVVASSKPRSENSDGVPHVDKTNEVESVANDTASAATIKANSPVPDASVTNEVKNVPKAVDDGAKRVNAKPKWNRFEVEPKSSSQNRRKTDRDRSPAPPRRNNRDDYYSRRDDRVRDDDRSSRRGNSTRGSVASSSSRAPRSNVAQVPPAAAPASSSVKSTTSSSRGPRREPAYITRSNRPSYTESKTPGLNGNPLLPMKNSDMYDAKKQKPLLGRPILIDPSAIAPLVTAQNIYGTYYFNGPTPFTLDTIGNIKESIKKQM
jgi:hypothetical protein